MRAGPSGFATVDATLVHFEAPGTFTGERLIAQT